MRQYWYGFVTGLFAGLGIYGTVVIFVVKSRMKRLQQRYSGRSLSVQQQPITKEMYEEAREKLEKEKS